MLIEWESKLNLGVPVIDAEHRYLVALVNNLHDSLGDGQGGADLLHLFAHLVSYVGRHFRNEEALMEAVGYPALDEHRVQHEELEEQTSELSERFLSEGDQVSAETMEFLRDWICVHVMSDDQDIGAFLHGKSLPTDWERVPAYAQLSEDVFKRCTMCDRTWSTFDDLVADAGTSAIGCMVDDINLYYNLVLFNCSCGTTLALQLAEVAENCDIDFVLTEHAGSEPPPDYCLRRASASKCLDRCACAYTSEILTLIA